MKQTDKESEMESAGARTMTSVATGTNEERPLRPIRRPTKLQGALAGTGSSWHEALLGLAGGVVFGLVSPCVGHPFDTVKTKMQADPRYTHLGLRATIRDVYRHEGVIGFYRGFVPPLLGSMAYRGLLFSAYSGVYSAGEQNAVLSTPIPYTGGLRGSVLLGALAASLARASVESPLDFIKLRMMIGKHTLHGHETKVSTSPSSLVSIGRAFAASPATSIQHLYHGFVPTLLRTTGVLGSFFILVDYSVRYIPEVVNAPVIGPFFKGGLCATAAWALAFPLETAKSVIQAQNSKKTTLTALRELYHTKGLVKGWYRGFAPGASRSFFANGASMMVYSWFQEAMRKDL